MSHNKSLLLACASMLAMSGWSASALAADAAADATAKSGQLEEVVVTARRVQESLQSVPIAVTALSPATIRQEGIKNVRDLLGQAPALFVTSGTGGVTTVNLSIRGQSNSNSLLFNAVTVGTYFNGVSYPRAVGLRSAMYDIADVQILKGPQGTLFGKNTTGGALLINTKTPSLSEFGGFGQVTAGNYHLRQFIGGVTVPVIPDILAVRLAVLDTHRDGYGNSGALVGAHHETGNTNEEGARLTVLYKPTDNVRLLMTADTLKVRGGGNVMRVTGFVPTAPNFGALLTTVGTGMGLANPGLASSQPAELAKLLSIWRGDDAYHNQSAGTYGHFDQGGASADLSIDFQGLTFRSISGVRDNNRDDFQDYDGTPYLILQPDSLQESKNFTQEFQLLNDPTSKFAWIIGGFYNKEDGTEGSKTFSLGSARASITDYTVHNRSYAAFAQINYSLTDKLRITAGGRYTKETEHVVVRNHSEQPLGTFFACSLAASVNTLPAPGCLGANQTSAKKPTYMVSVDYKPIEDVLVYGKVSSSFQAGGINITSASLVPFLPEQATVFEGGIKGDYLDHRLRINAAAYYTKYSDIQRTQIIVFNNALTTTVGNASKARIKGAEFEVTARPIEPLTLTASGSVVDVKYTVYPGHSLAEPFPTPKYQYAMGATYVAPTPVGKLALHASYHYQSTVNFNGAAIDAKSNTQSGYGLWDARATLSLPYDSSIALYVKNITNKTYLTNTISLDSSFGYNIGWIGDPRTVGVEFRKEFGGG
jgi:iron complex outermembrane receptor protein